MKKIIAICVLSLVASIFGVNVFAENKNNNNVNTNVAPSSYKSQNNVNIIDNHSYEASSNHSNYVKQGSIKTPSANFYLVKRAYDCSEKSINIKELTSDFEKDNPRASILDLNVEIKYASRGEYCLIVMILYKE